MKILDAYRLELHWDSLSKLTDSVCVIHGGYFSGPALRKARRINAPDSITIDFTGQYSRLLSSYYFAKLFWESVDYTDDMVLLSGCRLVGDFVNKVSELENTSYIVIDTEKHEESVHNFNLVYAGKVVNREGKDHGDV